MSADNTGLAAVHAAVDQPNMITRADHDAVVASAVAAAREETTASVSKAAAVAVQARIQAITGSKEAAGRADLASHLAFNTDMTAEAAIATLAASPKAEAPKPAVSRLDALMEGQQPKIDAAESGPAARAASLGAAVDRQIAKLTGKSA